jgi:hypothetical protein
MKASLHMLARSQPMLCMLDIPVPEIILTEPLPTSRKDLYTSFARFAGRAAPKNAIN